MGYLHSWGTHDSFTSQSQSLVEHRAMFISFKWPQIALIYEARTNRITPGRSHSGHLSCFTFIVNNLIINHIFASERGSSDHA